MSMNFATLEESELFLPFTRSSILCFTHILLNFWHRAGVRWYTFFFKFASSCVFIKQSQPVVLCHPFSRVPLIPKLRGWFAEFLQVHFLKRLSSFLPVYQCRIQVRFYWKGLFPGKILPTIFNFI